MREPSEAGKAAEKWHDDHIDELDHDYSSCWCCCITCEHTNPHFDAAHEAMTGANPTAGGPDA